MDIKQYEDIPPWEWPDDMGDMLLKMLQDPGTDADDLLTAVSMAGDPCVVDDELAEALMAIVENANADEALRCRAAISLGPALESTDLVMEFDDEDEEDGYLSETMFERIQGELEACYRNGRYPKQVRRRCLEASVRAPMAWHTAAIRSAYVSDDQEWRLTAVFAMNYIEGFDKEILESLKSEDPDIHYEAVSAAGNWEVEGAWAHIAPLLRADNTDEDLLLVAIEACVSLRPDKVDELVGPLIDHKDPDIADAAQEAVEMARAMLELDDDL
jgi:hypothetical protein